MEESDETVAVRCNNCMAWRTEAQQHNAEADGAGECSVCGRDDCWMDQTAAEVVAVLNASRKLAFM